MLPGIFGRMATSSDAPTTAYANAGGTGDRTATITVTEQASYSRSSGTLNNLVDGGTATNSTDSFNLTGAAVIGSGDYWRFDFGVGVSKYIDEMKLYRSAATSAGSWKIQGSNDASSWTDFATFTWNQATQTVAMSGMDPAGYRYYQVIENDTGASWADVWYEEVEFKIAAGV